MQRSRSTERTCVLWLALFAAAWFAVVATSASWTSFPLVLSDEANYLLPTLFGYREENFQRWGIVPRIPNLLYFRIYGVFPAQEMYAWAKLLNAAFIVAAAAPAYATARLYLRARDAAIFAVVVMCAPMSTFARYFMPECLYYVAFWCVVWMLLRTPASRTVATPIAAGIALGLLSLVKPHAVALVLAAGMFFQFRGRKWAAQLLDVAILVACFYAMHVVGAYLLIGTWDFSLGGPTYSAVLALIRFSPGPVLFNAFGHVASLFLLAGLPLLAVGLALFHELRRTDAPDAALRDLMLLALATLVATSSMAIWFSFAAFLSDPVGERITRLHGRYYAYALPLTILAYVAIVRRQRAAAFLFSTTALLACALVMAVAAFIIAGWYETSIVDYPELGVLVRWRGGVLIVVIAAIVGLGAAWMVSTRRLASDRMRRALPVAWWALVLVSTSALVLAAPMTGRWLIPNDVDQAMMNDAELRDLRQRPDGLVVGTDEHRADTFRVLFHLASLSRGRFIAPDTVLGNESIPPDVNWLILLPGVRFAGTGQVRGIGSLAYVKLR